MNTERLQALQVEADEWATVNYTWTPGGNNWVDVYMARFAELIVQECMNAVCDPSTTYLESMTDASAMYTARERIRKHFRS